MKKVITFGEIMLRLMPEDGHRFLQRNCLEATYGGGEANVAVSIANYGYDAAYVTALPNNDIGQAAINSLRYFGVDTTKILRKGERMGIYFVEKGQSQRPSKVIYDRKYSAISLCEPNDFDWDSIFEGVDWFHFTGITPALGGAMPEICMQACKAARKCGVKVSCDLNYRKNLWTTEEAHETMTKLMPYIDVCIANEEDAETVLHIHASGTDVDAGTLSYDAYKQVAKTISDKYGCSHVAITLRTSISANDNVWAGMLYDGKDYAFSREYSVRLFDRLGGGDSFGGGLIYGLLSGMGVQDAVDFAVAASCLKQTIQGDYNRVSKEDVFSLMRGSGTGRVQR